VPLAIWYAPSIAPAALNDQQEPHWPWSLIEVTAPLVTQSTDVGLGVSPTTCTLVARVRVALRL